LNNNTQRQVLALKYRPKRFDDLIGQDTISTTLSLALDTNRLSHAYLLSGLRGSGKTSTARIMSKALVCEQGPTSKPCEICANCVAANENKHLDIIEMDAASNRGIDDIKSLIEHTKYKPSSARYKVFIIDEVHMLTTQAFNALLKTLEEPPNFVKFILATTDPLKLPATILSRTQHFRFKRISDSNIIHHLSHILNVENIEYEKEALDVLTRAGQGSLRDTLTLLDQAIIYSKSIITLNTVTDMLGMIDPNFIDNIFETILQKKEIMPLVESLESYEVGQVLDEFSTYLKQRMLANDSRFDLYMYDRFFRVIADSKQLLSMNSDSGFVLILTLNKLMEATHLKTIDKVLEEISNTSSTKNSVDIEAKKAMQEQKTQKATQELTEHLEKSEIKTENKQDNAQLLFKRLIDTLYEKNYDLGHCFEESFSLNSFENNHLLIDSSAQGECKTLLFKNFSYIKEFIFTIFGTNTQIDFNKVKKKSPVTQTNTEDQIKPTIEEEPSPSSCVASMSEVKNPTPAQAEVSIEDVLNSQMTHTAMQLFQPKNPPQIKSKL
jgi:DNA polymerase-3 subunit gamma/tau